MVEREKKPRETLSDSVFLKKGLFGDFFKCTSDLLGQFDVTYVFFFLFLPMRDEIELGRAKGIRIFPRGL